MKKLLLIAASVLISLFSWANASAEENVILIDSIVASVNGKPITLSELNQRLEAAHPLNLKEAAHDPQAKEALDALILEKLIEEDAATRRVSVSDNELQNYVQELAARNGMSLPDFEQALQSQGKEIASIKRNARFEILRSRLSNQYLQSSVTISDDEVQKYLESNSNFSKSGTKLKLSQILLRTDVRTEAEAIALSEEILNKMNQGEEFAALAKQYSESSEGQEGGSLGILAEEDLSPELFDALFALVEGDTSKAINTAAGVHLFKVEQRFVKDEAGEENIKAEIKKKLRSQKVEERMYSYFSSELPKLYSVERKL